MKGRSHMKDIKTTMTSSHRVLEGQSFGNFMDVCPINLPLPKHPD